MIAACVSPLIPIGCKISHATVGSTGNVETFRMIVEASKSAILSQHDFRDLSGNPRRVFFLADDLCCVVLGGPGTTNALELRDAGSGQLKRKIPSARGFQVFCDGFSGGATQLRGDAKKGNVSLNGLKDNELRRVIRTDTGYAGGMAFSGDGRILAIQSSSEDLIGRYLLYDIVERF